VEGSVDCVDRPGERGGIRLMRRAFTPGDLKLGKYRSREFWAETAAPGRA